jgi:SAM-dependent methyltransferase
MSGQSERYILATGEKETERLRLLHEVYGPNTEALLRRVGLRPGLCDGMRVVELGCGNGNVACYIAKQIGPRGSVVGIDNSPDQIEQARKQAQARRLTNVEFRVGDAGSADLPEGTFDMAYGRLILMHLAQPGKALERMRLLVRPGGHVVCEEMDLTSWICEPPSDLVRRFYELNITLGERHGGHFRLGRSLPHLFLAAGFAKPEVGANFPLALRGEQKRLLELTFREFAPELVHENLATQSEVDQITAELSKLAADESTLFGFPLLVQVWARR